MKNHFGEFDESVLKALRDAYNPNANSFAESYDFKTCQRSDGTTYGTAGDCTQLGSKEVKKSSSSKKVSAKAKSTADAFSIDNVRAKSGSELAKTAFGLGGLVRSVGGAAGGGAITNVLGNAIDAGQRRSAQPARAPAPSQGGGGNAQKIKGLETALKYADTPEQKQMLQGMLDKARAEGGTAKSPLTGGADGRGFQNVDGSPVFPGLSSQIQMHDPKKGMQSAASAAVSGGGNVLNPIQYDPKTGNKINNRWNWDDHPEVERSPQTARADYKAMERIRQWERANMPATSQWGFTDSHNPESIWRHPANEGYNRPGGNFWEPGYKGTARDVHGQTNQVGRLGVSKSGTADVDSDPGTGRSQLAGLKNLRPHHSVRGLEVTPDGQWGKYKGRRVKKYTSYNMPDFDSVRSGAVESAVNASSRDGAEAWYYQ